VIQYNKRDVDDAYTIEELEKELNPKGVPYYEAVAMSGEGVFECFRGIGKVLLTKLSKEIKLEERASSKVAKATAAVEAARAAAKAEAQPAAKPELVKAQEPKAKPDPKKAEEPKKHSKASKDGWKPSSSAPNDVMEVIKQAASPVPAEEKGKVLAGPGSDQSQPHSEPAVLVESSTPMENNRPAVVVSHVDRPGFWGRLFGKKDQSRLIVMTSPEAPATGEVKTITVPVQLDVDDLKPGTQVRLILNIEVRASDKVKAA